MDIKVIAVLASKEQLYNRTIEICYIINPSWDEERDCYSSKDISEQLYTIYMKGKNLHKSINWVYFREFAKFPLDIINMEKQAKIYLKKGDKKTHNQLLSKTIEASRAMVDSTYINQTKFRELIEYLLWKSEKTSLNILESSD